MDLFCCLVCAISGIQEVGWCGRLGHPRVSCSLSSWPRARSSRNIPWVCCGALSVSVSVSLSLCPGFLISVCLERFLITGMCANLNILLHSKYGGRCIWPVVLGVLCTNCCLQIFFSESILTSSCWVLYLGCICQPQSLAVHISVESFTSTFVLCCKLKQLVGMNVK